MKKFLYIAFLFAFIFVMDSCQKETVAPVMDADPFAIDRPADDEVEVEENNTIRTRGLEDNGGDGGIEIDNEGPKPNDGSDGDVIIDTDDDDADDDEDDDEVSDREDGSNG